MKRILALIFAATLLAASPAPAGWFDNKEEQQIHELQQQLDRERDKSAVWQIISGVFAVGCVSLLVVGTVLGSNTRRARKEEPPTPESHEHPAAQQ